MGIFFQATAELNEAFKRPEAVPALCEIVVTSKESQHRQYSAVLLSKRLGKLRNWQLVPVEQQLLYVKKTNLFRFKKKSLIFTIISILMNSIGSNKEC